MRTIPAQTVKVYQNYVVLADPTANENKGSLVVFKDDKIHSRFSTNNYVYNVGEFVWLHSGDSNGSNDDNDIVLVTSHRDRIGGNIIGLDMYKFVKKWVGNPISGDYEFANFKEHMILLSNDAEAQSITFRSGRVTYTAFSEEDLIYHFDLVRMCGTQE
jgi:hypothetical protein